MADAARIKTFLIADVRGYTSFTQQRGDEAAARLATKFAEVARATVDNGGGRIVELRGDEALGVFDSAREAIRAAIELQRRFVDETVADPTLPLAVGIGLDAGEAVPVDGGYRGGALNLAARLCSLADPGEVLASREVTHLARKLDGVAYAERGSVRLKGLAEPIPVITIRSEREDASQNVAFRRALGATAVASRAETRNPYKGLRAFEEADAGDFFGREALTEHLVERLATTRFLALVGPSGSGKSSVVRAGLVPALRSGALDGSDRWPIAQIFPGAYPLEELEAALLKVAESPPASLLEQLEADDRGLLRALKRVLPDDGSELVLVLDQLEEVFTLVEGEDRRVRFLAMLERAVTDPRSRLRVVATLRADFYDRPLLYSGFAQLLRDYVEALVPLTPDEFERAIAEPAERAGVTLEPGLLSELVADVASEPGALPLLQYALTELYERREGTALTREAYRAIGGVSGALAGRAEEIYAGLDEAGQDAARQLYLRLVTLGEGAEDTRRRVERTELAAMEVDQGALTAAIDGFGFSRLLSFDRDPRTGTATVEVAHEALLREWGRLRRWIDSAREDVRLHRRLAAAAREWETSGRDGSFLLRGSQLAQFEPLADESRVALTDLERGFVTASRDESRRELERQERENRRLRILLAGVGVLLLLAVAAGIVALVQRQSSKHEATIALAGELGARAVAEPRIDRAMLLAREAVNLHRSPQTEGTLLATLLRSPAALATFTVPITVRPCCDMSLSPNGRLLAVPDNSSNVRFIDPRTRRTVKVLPGFGYTVAPAFSRDSKLVAGYGDLDRAPTLDVRDTRTFARLRRLSFDRRWLTTPTGGRAPSLFSPDRSTLYYVYDVLDGPDQRDGQAYVDAYDLRTGKLRTTGRAGMGAGDAVLLRGGRELAVAGTDAVTFLDAKTLKPLRTRPIPANDGGDEALSAAGTTLALGSEAGAIRFVDVASGRVTRGLGGHPAPIVRVRFSPDGRHVVSTAEDGSVIVWDSKTAEAAERLAGHASRTLGAAFDREGNTLFTSSLDGAIFEWGLGTGRRFGVPFTVSSNPAPRLSEDAVALTVPLAHSPDGSRFATRVGASKVGLYSTSSLRRLALLDGGSPEVTALAWSRSGALAVTGDNGRVALWDATHAPRLVRTLKGLGSVNKQPETVISAAFSHDGRLLAAGDVNHTPERTPYRLGTVAVWDARTGRLLWKKTGKDGTITTVAFAPDGKTLAAGDENGIVRLRDARTGDVKRVVRPLGGAGEIAVFAPDGTLATGSGAGIVQRWNPTTGAQIGHPALVAAAPVASISFSPSGDTFATSGGSDGLAKIWVTKTEQQFGTTFPGDPGQWGNAQYTPDGSKLIVVYQDGKAFAWPASLGAWERHACAVAGRNFTREEWSRFVGGGHGYTRICS